MKPILLFILCTAKSVSYGQAQLQQKSSQAFSEGIIYSRTSFPGHKLNDSIKTLDFESGDFVQQHDVIQALKKYQQSLKQENEQEIKDAFFVSGMMVLPMYSKMYFSSGKAFISTDALGYHQQLTVDKTTNSGILVLNDRKKENQGTVRFQLSDIGEVWQKYQIDAAQYSMQTTNETAVVAGYKCKKVVYTFGGTSRGSGVSNYIINLLPVKVTAWYTDELSPLINLIHPLEFEMNKAVLKFEVEYDKNGKNRMLVEVSKLVPQKINDDDMQLKEIPPKVDHQKNGIESGMMIMQVMMNAISLLTK